MKAFVIGIAVVLVGSVAGLILNQRQLGREVAQLRALNAELRQQPARAHLAPDDLAQAQARLEQTQITATLAEQRLTNLLGTITRAEQQAAQRSFISGADSGSARLLRHGNASLPPGQPRPPVSSHSPAGHLLNRSWGPEQIVGAANTDRAGDIATAWASLDPDGGEEWLHVNYDRMVDISEVRVRETYHPGAISKIAALLPNGQEVTIWEGTEPLAEAPVDTAFSPSSQIRADSVKIYLDTRRVPGWNEIDAVELIGSDGTRQWASSARASSSYADK